MSRILLMIIATLATSISAFAEPAKTFPVAELEKKCIERWGKAIACDRIAQQARLRYGEQVTGFQWQSAIGVIQNKVRQGK